MYRVRYYGEVIHPDHFRKYGWRGLVIRLLNWFRWKLETLVQYLVIRLIAHDQGLEREKVKELLRSFRVDTARESLEKEVSSPLHREPIRVVDEPSPDRSVRYLDAPVQNLDSAVASMSEQPVRPVPLDTLIGKFGFGDRQTRYALPRWGPTEDQFGPVEEE